MSNPDNEVKETAAQKADAEVGVKEWNTYVTDFAPVIQRWSQGVAADKTADKEIARGITNADLSQATSGMEKTLTRSGINPNSGKAIMALEEAEDDIGSAGAGASVSATRGVDDTQLAGMNQVANIGMGQKTEAVEGIGDVARESVSDEINRMFNKQQSRFANIDTAMAGAGILAGMDWSKGGYNNKNTGVGVGRVGGMASPYHP